MLSTIIVLISVLGTVYGMNSEYENRDRISDLLLKIERLFFTVSSPCIVINSYNRTNQIH